MSNPLALDPQPFKLSVFGDIILGVSDLARSVAFYRDILGFHLQRQGDGFAFFLGGGVSFVLSEPLLKMRPGPIGAMEIVFNVDDVRGAWKILKNRGLGFTTEPMEISGTLWGASFDDPDGHHLSILGPEHKTSG